MNESRKYNLPFWETFLRSLAYVIKNRSLLCKISGIGILALAFQLVCEFSELCIFNDNYCQNKTAGFVSNIFMTIFYIAVSVNYCRAVIIKVSPDFISANFWKVLGRYLMIDAAFMATMLIPFLVVTMIMIAPQLSSGEQIQLSTLQSLVLLVFFIWWAIYLTPFLIKLPATAVEDASLTLRKINHLINGNKVKIFCGQVLISIPISLVLLGLKYLLQDYNADNIALKIIMVTTVIELKMIDSCLKASYLAHLYQFFDFYKKKEEDEDMPQRPEIASADDFSK